MEKCLKRARNTKITSILKIAIISHVVPQSADKLFANFGRISVPLPHFWSKKSKFSKNNNKKKDA